MSTHLKSALSEPVMYVSRDPAIDVVEVAPPKPAGKRAQRLAAARASTQALADRRRNRALATCCSDYWIREKMAGRRVYPSTPCRCVRCKGRRQWPNNAYVNSRGLSFDCQVERQKPDEELIDHDECWSTSDATAISMELAKRAKVKPKQMRLEPVSKKALLREISRADEIAEQLKTQFP